MDIDQATKTMIDNLHKNTGKTLEQWIALVKHEAIGKHGEIIKFLKEQHQLTYGFANLIAHKSKESDAGSTENSDDMVIKQYQGKEHFRPMYDLIIAPKKTYVSLRRNKQFATLQPATNTRFEIGINLKGQKPKGKLEAINSTGAMCSHKIKLGDLKDLDDEVIGWLKTAYDHAK